jgi:hypothetical protein
MSFTKKIVSVAAGVALIAGAGAMAATPVSASSHNPTAKTKGGSVLSVPPALVSALAGAGVTLGVAGSAEASIDGSTGYTEVAFPLAPKPKTDGVIPHMGDLTITSAGTGVTLTFARPWIEYATSPGSEGAVLAGIVTGIPDWMAPFNGLNGQRLGSFSIPDWAGEWEKGKVRKIGKNFKRTDTFTGGGTVTVRDQDVANIFNTALFGPGVSVLQPGQEIGTIQTEITNEVICKTKKACK